MAQSYSLKLWFIFAFAAISLIIEKSSGHKRALHPRFLKFNDLSIKYPEEDEDPSRWNKHAEKTLFETLNKRKNTRVAKNTILFIGDGMGISTVTAGLQLFNSFSSFVCKMYSVKF
jgi:hypothetical protein